MSSPIHITPKEALLLRAFASSDFYDGPGSATYVPDLNEKSGLSAPSFAAVYGSLVAKGVFVTLYSAPKNPSSWFTGARPDGGATLYPDTCELTDEGEDILQALLAEPAPAT
ncbi:hypothetical protein E8E01_19375 [Methylorubrum populi]|uniref:hypothetical protein n=1 Tax=Methylorubrum populi TaxID=223967 RepID=UPI001154F7FE|nr:hypothetical protein [Methylorubrum populi]QDI82424.1 hypothetical protein E8E01_19375 [Methylorubrum populi]